MREYFDALLEELPEAKPGKMFGKDTLRLGRRPFAMFYQDHLVVKLAEPENTEARQIPGTFWFAPMGEERPMKNWVCIPFREYEEWVHWARLAQEHLIAEG